jgi:hypothetical protein
MAQSFGNDEQERDHENPENGGGDHAAEYRSAHRLTRKRAGSAGNHQWK